MGGMEKSKFYQYFKILYGYEYSCFMGGGISEDMEFGVGNCMFEFSTIMHIILVLSDKYKVFFCIELISSLLYMCCNFWRWGSNYGFFAD